MAFEIPGFSYSLEASTDLSLNQFHAVAVDGNGQAALAGNGAQIAGVLQNKPEQLGDPCTLVQTGITKMKSGAAVTQGAEVMSDADGEAIAATGSGNRVIGTALEAASGPDEIISVLLLAGGGQLN